jgi:hypothetical protein
VYYSAALRWFFAASHSKTLLLLPAAANEGKAQLRAELRSLAAVAQKITTAQAAKRKRGAGLN